MKKYNQIPFYNTELDGKFWGKRQEISRDVTIDALYDRFAETHRFEAAKCDLEAQEKEGWRPHIFWDSDSAKWMEACAYRLESGRDAALEKKIDDIIDDMCKSQLDDGYYNCYFSIYDLENRFTYRTEHELYCLGHLIEAAVAYYHATGKDKLLGLVERYTELVYRVFVVEKSAKFATPGHEEIELSLVKLYRATNNEKYLELAKFFIDQRGNNELDRDKYYDWATANYAQDHLPVREQTTAEGHSVRAMYLYMAMADLARECDDEALYNACDKIFNNVADKRMYITGGIGSSPLGEAFTVDYDLPNERAYTETCATLALSLFCQRMSKLAPKGIYGDIAERALYNGSISGVSISGDKFFYENPLTVDLSNHHKNPATKEGERYPITQRVRVFGCSCCPPNILRYTLSVADFLYTYDEDTLYVHHYMNGKTECDGICIVQTTNYPVCGKVSIKASGASIKNIAIRVPGWCLEFTADAPYTMKDGYAYFNGTTDIDVDFNIKPAVLVSNESVHENASRAAVSYGPVIYCLEGIDNEGDIFSLVLDEKTEFDVSYDDYFSLPVIAASGFEKRTDGKLYAFASDVKYIPRKLKFIPYYGMENRGETSMLVWMPYR